jgi:hypothetical protein
MHPATARLNAHDRKAARRAERLERLIELVKSRPTEPPDRIGKRLMLNPANVRSELAAAGYEWRDDLWRATPTSTA